MDLTPYLEAVRADLEAVAGSDEATLAVAERLARALEASLQLRMLDALGQAAQELGEQLPSGRIDVRLSGRDVHLVLARRGARSPEALDGGGRRRHGADHAPAAGERQDPGRAAGDPGGHLDELLARPRGDARLGATAAQQRQRRVGNRITGLAQS